MIAPMRRFFLPVVMIAVLVGSAGCARSFRIAGAPFVHSEVPADFPKAPLTVALVDSRAMRRIPTTVGKKFDLDKLLAAGAMQGLYDAARLVAQHVVRVAPGEASEADLICTPSNPTFELRRHPEDRFIVLLTMEVTVRDAATGKERGLLLSSEGRPGRRPAVPIEATLPDNGRRVGGGVTGALISGSPFEQAVNNALFWLALDFSEKLMAPARDAARARQGGA
jgi:hypothetical protein